MRGWTYPARAGPPTLGRVDRAEGRNVMQAAVGDRVVVLGAHVDEATREGEVVEVHGEQGGPPWVVRWSRDGRETLFYPGPDVQVTPSGEPSG